MTDMDHDSFTLLNLFNLSADDVQNIRCSNIPNHLTEFFVTLVSHPTPCPLCGCDRPKIKNYVPKKITHDILAGRRCCIIYRARRYICPVCSRTYYEHNPFVFRSMKISAATVINILDELKDFNETFTSVARRHNVSPTSACSIFDSHVQLSRLKLPEVLSIDEVYAFHSPTSKYVCVLLDFISQVPVDILPDRKFDYLLSYFLKIPLEERENVKIICTDMYEPYRKIAQKVFPGSFHAVDHFHVAQELHRQITTLRIRIMKKYKHEDDGYYLLKNFNWMLFKDPDDSKLFDPNIEKKYNRHFRQYMNFYDIREKMLEIDDSIRKAYDLKKKFRDFYSKNDRNGANKNIDALIQDFLASDIEEMNRFGHTMIKWKNEIINSFIIAKKERMITKDGKYIVHDRKVNNALIENRNRIIKCLKNNANGYTNWFRFRNRVLYVLRPDATYYLEPQEIPWKNRENSS